MSRLQKVNRETTILIFLCLMLRPLCATENRFPSTPDEMIETLTRTYQYFPEARMSLLALGPEAAPNIMKRLRSSLDESVASPGIPQVLYISQLPEEDQVQARYQTGLVVMLGDAIRFMDLPAKKRATGLSLLVEALKSPYSITRKAAIRTLRRVLAIKAEDYILPFINDPDQGVRSAATSALREIGTQTTAKKMRVVLDERRAAMSAEEQHRDVSLRSAEQAIIYLSTRPFPKKTNSE